MGVSDAINIALIFRYSYAILVKHVFSSIAGSYTRKGVLFLRHCKNASRIASVDENFAPQVAEALRYFVQLIFHRRSLEERDALVDIIRQHIHDHKELENMAQTTAEFLIEQGKTEGKAEGKVEGKAEGKAEGKQDAVLKLLQLRFQHVPETISREISNIHNHIQLDILLEQAMTVQSLEEIDTHFS